MDSPRDLFIHGPFRIFPPPKKKNWNVESFWGEISFLNEGFDILGPGVGVKERFPDSLQQLQGKLYCGQKYPPCAHLYLSTTHKNNMYIQVVPGRAGGGSFRRKKNYIAKKEFAYRMCARRPTSAMPKPFLCCERAFCCSMVVMWPVLTHVMSFDVVVMSFDAMWLLVLCHVTWCNAMSCDVRSCDVPCNGHVVCSKWFCDNVVIQSTILYYKVLLQYYSVLQSTTLYYTVLQRTTPVLLCTTSSTAQGGGGSFKKRKTIGEIGCCESRVSKQKHWPTD